jgi:hypothetical protein
VTIASGTISDLIKKSERLEKQIEGLNNFANERFDEIQRVRRERDKAREENAKLRDIAEKAIVPLECDGVPWGAKLRLELDQLKEGEK